MNCKSLLFKFIKNSLHKYIIGTFLLILTTYINSLIPKIIGKITDGLNLKNITYNQVLNYVFTMMLIVVSVFVLKFIWRYLLIGNARNVEIYLRDHLFAHLQTLPVTFYNTHKTGDLISHAISDIQAVRMIFAFGYIAIIEGVFINLFSIFYMVKTTNPILTLFALIPIPFTVFIMIKLRKEIRNRFIKVQQSVATIAEKVQENIMGIRVVKSFAQEEEEIKAFEAYSQNRVHSHMNLIKVSASLGPASQICFGFSFLLFIIYGSKLVMAGSITIGDFVAFNTYIMTIMSPILNIARIIEIWQKGFASISRLDKIFEEKQTLALEVTSNDFLINGEIEIKNLSFSYPGHMKKVLKNINLKIPKGHTLGVLGQTGSGKTTLVNLLLRLYDVDNGHIFIDGNDINNISAENLRESIGFVPQDNFLFSTTIKENIEFFKHIHSDDEIFEATRVAGVYDNIAAFPNGFDTVIGERGVTLSGGQKQRISIARAIVKDPSILIFDDSLSAVDTKTETLILTNIKNVLKSRTGIIISHRVSTVKHCDEIIMLDKGKIVERGNHDTLMSQHGFYYNLFSIQSEDKEEAHAN